MTGFFSAVGLGTNQRRTVPLLPRCGQCKLHLQCISPKMPVDGEGKRGVLVIAEAPGKNEDEQNRPLIGDAGQLLRRCLNDIGVDLNRDCWLTNSLICRPPKNRTPTDNEIDHCRPNIVNAIKLYQPETILLLGSTAVKSVIGWLWKDKVDALTRWTGQRIPVQKINTWVCPTWHPSYLLRMEGARDYPLMERLFTEHLEAAFALKGRPWKQVPDYASQVQIILDSDRVVNAVKQMLAVGRPVAFDIETDRMKPDASEAVLWTASLSDGKTTIAYPWQGKAIQATLELLQSRIPKLGWNQKFESRWLKAKHGIWIKNWAMDGMLASHMRDNRTRTKSLKFQAFVRLGQDSYDDEIKPFLQSRQQGGNSPNRIREAPLSKLLTYGGLDALLEWKLDVKLVKELGVSIGG